MKNSRKYLFVLLALGAGLLAGWLGRSEPAGFQPGSPTAGSSVLQSLRGSLPTGQRDSWLPMVEALGRERGTEARTEGPRVLFDVYRLSGETGLRAAILAALETLGSPQACESLAGIYRLDNEDSPGAAMRLSRIKDPLCLLQLKEIIEEEKRAGELARAAVRALGRTRSRAAANFCEELCADTYEVAVRREAAEALGMIAELSSVLVLAELLGSAEVKLRQAAINSLGLIRSEHSREVLESHRLKQGLGERETILVQEALERLLGKEPARLR
ncbi:MAG: HEAT repeat domain-containing protein [Planctomycetota bacterium]|nr:HEAT repeat domain-containing protein [Planctomycetota bacterium]